MHRVLRGLFWAVSGYVLGAVGGGFVVYAITTNRHDRSMEAGMTGVFFLGPVVAVIAFLVGVVRKPPVRVPSAT